MALNFDDINELLHAIRMKVLGAKYGGDSGDEDDETPARALARRLPRVRIGRTVCVYPARVLPPLEHHDPGDEEPRLVPIWRMEDL